MMQALILFLLSAATGILSGWGVGGGTLLTVCMTLLLGIEHRTAQAVNLLFFLPTAALSLWFHRKNDLIARDVWLRCAAPGTLAALLGALLALAIDLSFLRKLFGGFLIYSAISMLKSAKKY